MPFLRMRQNFEGSKVELVVKKWIASLLAPPKKKLIKNKNAYLSLSLSLSRLSMCQYKI